MHQLFALRNDDFRGGGLQFDGWGVSFVLEGQVIAIRAQVGRHLLRSKGAQAESGVGVGVSRVVQHYRCSDGRKCWLCSIKLDKAGRVSGRFGVVWTVPNSLPICTNRVYEASWGQGSTWAAGSC